MRDPSKVAKPPYFAQTGWLPTKTTPALELPYPIPLAGV